VVRLAAPLAPADRKDLGRTIYQRSAAARLEVPENGGLSCGVNGEIGSRWRATPLGLAEGSQLAAPRPGERWRITGPHLSKCLGCSRRSSCSGKPSWRNSSSQPGLSPAAASIHQQIEAQMPKSAPSTIGATAAAAVHRHRREPPELQPAQPTPYSAQPAAQALELPLLHKGDAWQRSAPPDQGVATTIVTPSSARGREAPGPEVGGADHRIIQCGSSRSKQLGLSKSRAQQRASFCFHAHGELAGQTNRRRLPDHGV